MTATVDRRRQALAPEAPRHPFANLPAGSPDRDVLMAVRRGEGGWSRDLTERVERADAGFDGDD